VVTGPQAQQEEIARLKRAVEELSLLNELARDISVSRDLDEINRIVVNRSLRAVQAEQANITLVDREKEESKGTLRFERHDGLEEHFHLNQTLLGMMFHERRAQLFNDVRNAEGLRNMVIEPGIRNLVSVPLMAGAELIGVLSAYNKIGGGDFTPEDKRILAIIGAQSAQVLENARREGIIRANEDMERDMILAEAIQEALLPDDPPGIPGYDICGTSVAAGHVGGDYYDFIPLEDRRWVIALGDVSGKGVPASLLMSNLQATLRSLVHFVGSCHQCVTACNRMLYLSTTPDKFATLFLSVLDTRSNVLTYCNAGHEQPFLVTAAGEVRRLDRGGLAVGILKEVEYEDEVVLLQPGDLVVIFSDGVTDMANPAEEYYGEERLLALVRAHRHQGTRDLVDLIRRQVREHAARAAPADDVTVVAVKRTE